MPAAAPALPQPTGHKVKSIPTPETNALSLNLAKRFGDRLDFLLFLRTTSDSAIKLCRRWPKLCRGLSYCKMFSRSLRSASDTRIFRVPRVCRRTLGERSFQYIGPIIWNSLPFSVRHATSLSSFFQVKTENSPLLFCLLIYHFLFSVSIKPMTTMLVFLRGVCVCVCVFVCVPACLTLCVCLREGETGGCRHVRVSEGERG